MGQELLRGRLNALDARRANDLDLEADAISDSVRTLLDRARDAAYRVDPQPQRFSNWWRGTLIELAYQNLHAAKAQIVLLYNPAELAAEVPDAAARADAGLKASDPRVREARALLTRPETALDPQTLSRVIEAGYSAGDEAHARVRSFRNMILIATLALTVFVAVFVAYVYYNPTLVSLCFGSGADRACPTSQGASAAPQGRDILALTLLGLMGGTISAAVSIRNVRGTSTPYDVPVVLALLKLPAGALSAIAAVIAIRGDFVPGLSSLDSAEQILAYALVFGYAQQLLTRLLDRQGQDMLSGVPSKDVQGASSGTLVVAPPPPPSALPDGSDAADSDAADSDAADSDAADEEAPVDDGSDDSSPDDESDVEDPQPRDVPDATIEDDSGTVEDLPEDEPDPPETPPIEDDETLVIPDDAAPKPVGGGT